MRALVVLACVLLASCRGPAKRFDRSLTLGGRAVPARVLNRGSEAYQVYCSACHGRDGDGRGPAGIGLRPPPRDFRQGRFKFAAVASGQLPNDDDLLRTLRGGLHGTAMLPWKDVPDDDLVAIVQFLKTLSPRWLDRAPGKPIVPGPDPWGDARRREAEARGSKVYHALAQCLSCHPAYVSAEDVDAASRELLGRPSTLREDPFHSVWKDSDYGTRLMPPDFRRDALRAGRALPDLYRVIASGVGGTAMPSWKGSLPEDDLWAMAYYVRSLTPASATPASATPASASR